MRRLSVAILLLGLVTLFSCGAPTRQEREAEAQRAARERRIQDLAARHGADSQWRGPFEDYSRLQFFSVEIQRALIKPDKRPVVIVAPLGDVIEVGGNRYELRAHIGIALTEIHFFLQASDPLVSELLAHPPEFLEEVAVVARIHRVARAVFRVATDEPDEEERTLPNVVIEPGEELIATGDCIEIARFAK